MNAARLPAAPPRLGLAVGLDVPWGSARGLVDTPAGGSLAPAVARFLARYGDHFAALFLSVQPRRREVLDAATGAAHAVAFRTARAALPHARAFSLHHTRLDTAQPAAFQSNVRAALYAYTNALVEETGALWVNEDLGIWTLDGKSLPYPLPPIFTAASLHRCVATVGEVQGALTVPFAVEFPGFSAGAGFVCGSDDPLAFFQRVVEDTQSPCTLDTAHILGLCGQRGWHWRDVLDALPLGSCIDIHMSGTAVQADGTVFDAHHGVLHALQLELLEALLPRCPALRVVTYEDPRFDDDGRLIAKAEAGFARLRAIVGAWAAPQGEA